MNVFGGFYGSYIKRLLTDNPPFYPLYGNFFMNRKLPILVDINNLMMIYVSNPLLRTVIDKGAEMFANMEIKCVDINDEEKEYPDDEIFTLLEQPDAIHTLQDWLKFYYINKCIYSQAFIYKLKATSISLPKCLWHLPPGEMKIVPTGKLFSQTKIEDIIEKYTLMYQSQEGTANEPVDYTPDQIIHITDGVSSKYIVGESKLLTLRMAISNIDGALKTRNILINENAGKTFISPDGTGETMIPFDDVERKNVSDQMRKNYGLNDNQEHNVYTTSPVKVTPLVFPVKDMMLFEEIEEDFSTICGAYGMARDLFPSIKGSTFENQEQAEKRTYQDTTIPEARSFMRILSNDADLKLKSRGRKLIAKFDHINSLKADELVDAQSMRFNAIAADFLLKNGTISHETAAEMCGVEMTGDKVITGATTPSPDANQQQEDNGNKI